VAAEAATILQPAPLAEEEATRILTPRAGEGHLSSNGDESATILQPSNAPSSAASRGEEEATHILNHRTMDDLVMPTGAADGLTRVGSILGTPLYMSPEQCRSEPLSARTDIYSLGVIAYQMLSGRTPFAGDVQSVMRQHVEVPPPPLKEKKIPKKIARLVMATLAKNPDERPASAASVASSLRANSEGAGTLLRRALTLYSEHLPTFFRTAFLIFLPVLILTLLQLVIRILSSIEVLPRLAVNISTGVITTLLVLVQLFIGSVLMGVTTHMVTQVLVAPLRSVRLRPALAALRERLRPFATTTMFVNVLAFFGLLMGLVLAGFIFWLRPLGASGVPLILLLGVAMVVGATPGLIVMINYLLVPAVVLMEDKRGRAARARSKELTKRARQTVTIIVLILMLVPFIGSPLLAFIIAAVIKAFELSNEASLSGIIHTIIWTPIYFLIHSLSAVITSLLYLKTRQAGGETLKEALAQFDLEEVPRSKWQQRMRERSSVYTQAGR
jgi:hypothetical protein